MTQKATKRYWILIFGSWLLLIVLIGLAARYQRNHQPTPAQIAAQEMEAKRQAALEQQRQQEEADAKGREEARKIVNAMGYIQDRAGICYSIIVFGLPDRGKGISHAVVDCNKAEPFLNKGVRPEATYF